jgi:hypothetical protein
MAYSSVVKIWQIATRLDGESRYGNQMNKKRAESLVLSAR